MFEGFFIGAALFFASIILGLMTGFWLWKYLG